MVVMCGGAVRSGCCFEQGVKMATPRSRGPAFEPSLCAGLAHWVTSRLLCMGICCIFVPTISDLGSFVR